MSDIDVFKILGYGVIGLGFLLALLAYKLLTQEQKRRDVRSPMIRAVYSFMTFSVVLCGVGLASEYFRAEAHPMAWGTEIRTVRVQEGVPAYRFEENGVSVKLQEISACGDSVSLSLYGPKDHSAEARKFVQGEVIPLSEFGDHSYRLQVGEACAAEKWAKLSLRRLQ